MKKIIATVLAMVMALALCTTAFAATGDTVEGYLKGTNVGASAVKTTLTYTGNTDPKTTDGKTVAGVYAHYTEATYGDFIVVNSLADATAVLYSDEACKNVIMYLGQVEVVSYFTGKVYNDFADVCGKFDKPASYDATKTYYTYEDNGTTKLAVAAGSSETADKLLTVDGKVVRVVTLAATKVQHTAVPTVKDGKITGYTCSKCKAVAVEAPNYASIPAGADTTNLTGNWYWTTSTTPSTDKNTSPKTFDAGIAMYVGMALTSVAGAAVVIGKKKEF